MDLVLELKNNASKLLLAIMESRSSSDSENVAEKIIYNLNPKQLVRKIHLNYENNQVYDSKDHFKFNSKYFNLA